MIIYNGQVSHGVFWRGDRVFDFNPPHGYVLIASITNSGSYTIQGTYSKIGLFLVGGGGGGAGDGNSSDRSGTGGDGGQVKSFELDSITNNTIAITIGAGGRGGGYKLDTTNATSGEKTTVVVDGVTYTALGGRRGGGSGGDNSGIWPTKIENSARGGCSRSWTNTTYHNAQLGGRAGEGDPFVVSGTTYDNSRYAHGGYGAVNPFDNSDTNLYGAGGGGGANSYRGGDGMTQSLGGDTGGGGGGYGANNATTNKGQNATFYGGGGGGGAFSSNHTNSGGGNGYQGIVLIYGKP